MALSLLYRQPVKRQVPAVASGATARDEDLARVEAVLFLASEPLATRKLAQLASLADGTEARTLVRRLNKFYDAEQRSFRVAEVAGGFQLLTRPKFGGWLRKLYQSPAHARLSDPALETLVVVAYRQPVLRAQIEAIRGVQCGEMLRQLMERDLVRICGRAEELGRPFQYGTTRRFLQLFGLRNLDELPRAEFLRQGPNPLAVSEEPRNNNQPSDKTNSHRSPEEAS
jgi:segregation and condensation protein B